MNDYAKLAHSLAEFNRFDICEAHYCIEVDYNLGGWLHERKSNNRPMKIMGKVFNAHATDIQLHRMNFVPSIFVRELGYDGLTDNGKAIYNALAVEYGFKTFVSIDL